MVSFSGHILPVAFTVLVWFFATGLIAWLDNRNRATFPRSLMIGGVIGIGGLVMILVASHSVSALAIYAAFAGALMVWSWHEIGFLTGATAGPRREACPPNACGWARFSHASMTLIYHEIGLAVTAVLLVSLSWTMPNQIGAMVFMLMFAFRLSTKVNLFVGVPNTQTDILPGHLRYLISYYGPQRLHPLMLVSFTAAAALAAWLGHAAFTAAPGSPEMVGASLLFALSVLGAAEHLFLALPFRDGTLWGWALPSRR